MLKKQIKKLKSETVEQYLERFITEPPEWYASQYLLSDDLKDDIEENNPNCDWFMDIIDSDTKDEFDEDIEDIIKESEYQQSLEDEKLNKTESIRQELVSRFDDLFELTARYSAEFDKTYYIYKYKYCRDWLESIHLVIESDYYDFLKSDSFLKRRIEDSNHNYNYDQDWVMEGFENWLFYELSRSGCDSNVLDTLFKNDDFSKPYIESLFKIIDIEITDIKDIDSEEYIAMQVPPAERVSKLPSSWVYRRKGFPSDDSYDTKEEAFAEYLKDTNYGINDLGRDPESVPDWLRSILYKYNSIIEG